MTLEFLIQENNNALKKHLNLTRTVLTSVIANIKKAAIDKGCKDNITEQLVDEVLLKELKTVNEQIFTCPKDRADKWAEYRCVKEVLEKYAPVIITDKDEIAEMIKEACADAGIEIVKANLNTARKQLMPQFKGKADMKIVNQVMGEVFA